jgi:hypothetical protein
MTRRGCAPPVYLPPWERSVSTGVHAAFCRMLDVTAAYPLDIVTAEDFTQRGRKARDPVVMPVTFLAVPPR